MWAVESGVIGPDVLDDIIDYRCAAAFGWSPEVTAMQGEEKVKTMLFIDDAVKDRDRRDAENAARGGANARSV